MNQENPGFERVFRALGAWLDEHAPSRFSILEVPHGFEVIIGEGVPGSPREEHAFTRGELARREQELLSLRERKPAYSVPWKLAPVSRQDFLRALGHELDESAAAAVIVDELPDSILLTYSYRDPNGDSLWHKRSVRLGQSEIDEIMTAARDRRAH